MHFSGMPGSLREHIETISPLTDSEWEAVSPLFKRRKFRKHQYLVQQGDPVPYDFWVVSGLLKAYAVGKDGKEHILQFAMEDWWCSDYNAYQSGSNASIFIDCIEDSEVLCLRSSDKERICGEFRAMERFFRIKSGTGYVALQKRIVAMMKDSAEERFGSLIAQYPGLVRRVPKKMLAAYLGVSRETLSRLNK
jgi:CRP/FNR family transcriptional regulator, anaerobic regulatory protein